LLFIVTIGLAMAAIRLCDDASVSGPGPDDPLPEGTRRTQLANERTFLAWLRSGLGALAVGLAIAKLLPTLHEGASWPYVALGVAFSALGLGLIWLGVWRTRAMDEALRRGEAAPMGDRVVILVGVLTGVLAVLTTLVVLLNR
jgi:putative membrane protein